MRYFLYLLMLYMIFLLGCSNKDHAGVITDTHTGGKISGRILNAEGQPASARIRLVTPDFSAASDQPQLEITVASDGLFELDSIPTGDWLLLISNVDEKSTAIYDLSGDLLNSDEYENGIYDLGDLIAYPAATIFININDYELQLNDTLYVPGTGAATVINEDIIQSGVATLKDVPDQFSLRFLVDRENTTLEIEKIEAVHSAQKILLTADSIIQSNQNLRLDLPDPLTSLNGNFADIPFPLWLPNSLKQPCLVDSEEQLVALDSAFTKSDSILYWGTLPTFPLYDSSVTANSMTFSLIENCPASPQNIGRLALHMDQESDSTSIWGNSLWLDSNSTPYTIDSFHTFTDSGTLGLSFWLRMDADEQADTYTQIFDTRSENSGIRIQQKADRTTAELRIDTKDGAYNALFGASDIFTGNWHHYALSINENQVIVVIDGVTVADTTFELGSGFTDSYSPVIGGNPNMRGHIDELMIFDGSQSADWWKIFYGLQDPTVQWMLE